MSHPIFTSQPWRSPLSLPGSPVGMLGPQEAALFHAMAKDVWTGRGTIVDAGSFLGKSAFHFACGMRSNPHFVAGRDKVHCFDIFQVVHYTTIDFFRRHLGLNVRMGDGTREVFDRQVAPVKDLLEVYGGDLHVMPWQHQPIEILMIDVAKSESLGNRVVELFFPDLIPGASYVIHQDYHHAWHPHIHVVMSYLADYFDIVVARADASAAFFYKKEIPREVLQRAIRCDFTPEERARLIDEAIARLPVGDRPTIELLRLVTNGEETAAAEVLAALARFEQEHPNCSDDAFLTREMRGVRTHFLEKDGWDQLRNGRPDLVLQRTDELMAHDQRGGSVLAMRGAALRALGRPTEAEQDLRASMAMNPQSCFVINELAALLTARGQLNEAAQELTRGLCEVSTTEGELRRYLDSLGVAFIKSGNADWCCEVMERLRAPLNRQAEYWVLYARVNVHLNRRDRAQQDLGLAIARGLSAHRQKEIEALLRISAQHERQTSQSRPGAVGE
ncbi:MAG: hypothetical protein KA020_13505 [Planctomycetes bacterium]|jgi:Tfp pilus assembly protein PilF|nr:hypothetical protein [Planctomycetota bacterium]MCC7064736.1 hypothetical protein [Planctomycetota bacterium]